MQDTEILTLLLNLDDEWHINTVEVDRPSNRIDIAIAHGSKKKKSFFGNSKSNDDIQTIKLRHLPISGMRTYLHVPAPSTVESNKSWAPSGSQLTNEMEAFLIDILNNTKSNQAAAKISGVTAAEIREVSERTGAGADNLADALSNVANATNTSTSSPTDYFDTKSFELIEHTNIPPETHDNWQRIINGDQIIKTKAVGLQMLLQRIRQDIAKNPSEVSRIKSAKLLRQYFIKNQDKHKADIAIISGISTQASNQEQIGILASESSVFPGVNDAVWQKIINAELQIQTSNVALQMMMERVRQSVERNPSESSRQAGAKILRQFFIKHKARLSSESQQMGIRVSIPITSAKTDVILPSENASCWQQLVIGELKIQTNTVGLQMMLERVRQSVEKNTSETNRMAGIKILRQYFLKHQASSQNEILQLNGIAPQVLPTDNNDNNQITIPPETHPSWQRLINGELVINTDIVALKMMLQSIRISIENNPSDASRTAGAKILRQYFVKHQNKHRTELDQLIAA
tara:strand:- start:56503 stop:58056 length:1554 start_codon:yes stop_codon:yes gene_type:complete